MAKKWNPLLHPRDRKGRFIRKFGFVKFLDAITGTWHYGRAVGVDKVGGKDVVTVQPVKNLKGDPTGDPDIDIASSKLYAVEGPKAHLTIDDASAKKVGGQGGSNPGGLYELPAVDSDGVPVVDTEAPDPVADPLVVNPDIQELFDNPTGHGSVTVNGTSITRDGTTWSVGSDGQGMWVLQSPDAIGVQRATMYGMPGQGITKEFTGAKTPSLAEWTHPKTGELRRYINNWKSYLNDKMVSGKAWIGPDNELRIDKYMGTDLSGDKARVLDALRDYGIVPKDVEPKVTAAEKSEKFYVKKAKTASHGNNEALANALYAEAGVPVPEVDYNPADGNLYSKIVSGKQDMSSKLKDKDWLKAVQSDFAVDAWLGNRDVFGMTYDNILTEDGTGVPYRIDNGGALLYRAMGAPKTDFGSKVTELETFRDGKKSAIFGWGVMSKDEELDGAQRVIAISPEKITELVSEHGLPASLADTLKARRAYIADYYGIPLPESMKPADAEQPTSAPLVDPLDVSTGGGLSRNWTRAYDNIFEVSSIMESGDLVKTAKGVHTIGRLDGEAAGVNTQLAAILSDGGPFQVKKAIVGPRPTHDEVIDVTDGSEVERLLGMNWQRGDKLVIAGLPHRVAGVNREKGLIFLIGKTGDGDSIVTLNAHALPSSTVTVKRWDAPVLPDQPEQPSTPSVKTGMAATKAKEFKADLDVPLPDNGPPAATTDTKTSDGIGEATPTSNVKTMTMGDHTVASTGDKLVSKVNGKSYIFVKPKGPYAVVTDPDSDDPTKQYLKKASTMTQPGKAAQVAEDGELEVAMPASKNGIVPKVGMVALAKDGSKGKITMVSPDGKFVFIDVGAPKPKRKSTGAVEILDAGELDTSMAVPPTEPGKPTTAAAPEPDAPAQKGVPGTKYADNGGDLSQSAFGDAAMKFVPPSELDSSSVVLVNTTDKGIIAQKWANQPSEAVVGFGSSADDKLILKLTSLQHVKMKVTDLPVGSFVGIVNDSDYAVVNVSEDGTIHVSSAYAGTSITDMEINISGSSVKLPPDAVGSDSYGYTAPYLNKYDMYTPEELMANGLKTGDVISSDGENWNEVIGFTENDVILNDSPFAVSKGSGTYFLYQNGGGGLPESTNYDPITEDGDENSGADVSALDSEDIAPTIYDVSKSHLVSEPIDPQMVADHELHLATLLKTNNILLSDGSVMTPADWDKFGNINHNYTVKPGAELFLVKQGTALKLYEKSLWGKEVAFRELTPYGLGYHVTGDLPLGDGFDNVYTYQKLVLPKAQPLGTGYLAGGTTVPAYDSMTPLTDVSQLQSGSILARKMASGNMRYEVIELDGKGKYRITSSWHAEAAGYSFAKVMAENTPTKAPWKVLPTGPFPESVRVYNGPGFIAPALLVGWASGTSKTAEKKLKQGMVMKAANGTFFYLGGPNGSVTHVWEAYKGQWKELTNPVPAHQYATQFKYTTPPLDWPKPGDPVPKPTFDAPALSPAESVAAPEADPVSDWLSSIGIGDLNDVDAEVDTDADTPAPSSSGPQAPGESHFSEDLKAMVLDASAGTPVTETNPPKPGDLYVGPSGSMMFKIKSINDDGTLNYSQLWYRSETGNWNAANQVWVSTYPNPLHDENKGFIYPPKHGTVIKGPDGLVLDGKTPIEYADVMIGDYITYPSGSGNKTVVVKVESWNTDENNNNVMSGEVWLIDGDVDDPASSSLDFSASTGSYALSGIVAPPGAYAWSSHGGKTAATKAKEESNSPDPVPAAQPVETPTSPTNIPGYTKPSADAIASWGGSLTADGFIPTPGMNVLGKGPMQGKIISVNKDKTKATVLTSDGSKSVRLISALKSNLSANYVQAVGPVEPLDIPEGMEVPYDNPQTVFKKAFEDTSYVGGLINSHAGLKNAATVVKSAVAPNGKKYARVSFTLTTEQRAKLMAYLEGNGEDPAKGGWVNTNTKPITELAAGDVVSLRNSSSQGEWVINKAGTEPTHRLVEVTDEGDYIFEPIGGGAQISTPFTKKATASQSPFMASIFTWDPDKIIPPTPGSSFKGLSAAAKANGWEWKSSGAILPKADAAKGTITSNPEDWPIYTDIDGVNGGAKLKLADGTVVDIVNPSPKQHSESGIVVISVPEGGDSVAAYSSALAAMQLEHAPMTQENVKNQVRPLLVNMISLDMSMPDSSKGWSDEKIFSSIGASVGIPDLGWQDVRISVHQDQGRTEFLWSQRVIDAMAAKSSWNTVVRGGKSFNKVVDVIKYGAMDATTRRVLGLPGAGNGHGSDSMNNAGHGSFMSGGSVSKFKTINPINTSYGGGYAVYHRPEALFARIGDIRPGKGSHDAYGAGSGNGSNAFKGMLGQPASWDLWMAGGLPVDTIGYIAMNNEHERGIVLKELKSLGYTSIGGRPIEEVIQTASDLNATTSVSKLPVYVPTNTVDLNSLPTE